MPTLWKLDVSPRGDQSISRKLSKQFADQWQQSHSGGKIVTRDLATANLPYVDLPWIAGAYTPPDKHTPENKQALKVSDELIAELLASDEILISTPMYNFAVPAVLKAWIDHIVRVGLTFSVGPDGYKGLIHGKKATVIVASGSVYTKGAPAESYNAETPYLRLILGFLGITDVTVILAGGVSEISQGKTTPEALVAKFTPEVVAAAG